MRSAAGALFVFGLSCLGLVLLGCAEQSGHGDGHARGHGAAAAPVVDLDQLEAELREGGTPRLVNFWATWCVPCLEEMPELIEVAGEHAAEGLEVLAISVDLATGVTEIDTPDEIAAFAADRRISLPLRLFDGRMEPLLERLDLPGEIPVTLAFDASGREVARHEGAADAARFRELAAAALGR